jgi:glycosyltransferase involved in cell wall biosynthesis
LAALLAPLGIQYEAKGGAMMPSLQSVALISSYVPRMCGIATFTKDLREGLVSVRGSLDTLVLSMDDCSNAFAYPAEVRFRVRDSNPRDYVLAADFLNINQIDAAVIQHEFGIFGGESGVYVLALARRLSMPLITTLHTVVTTPTPQQRKIILALAAASEKLVVLCETARGILSEIYGIDPGKIVSIPHGIPDLPFSDPTVSKGQLGLERRTVLMTFGLLSPGKAIDVAIRALPAIVARHPQAIYIVLGATHPCEFRRDGNSYVTFLERLAEKCGVREHVVFLNRYVSSQELARFLAAADLYVTPYANREQIASGTLAMALGMGKAVLSTPYRYAEEMLAEGRGVFFPFGDSAALAESAIALIEDPERWDELRERAYVHSRSMIWKEVARRYVELAEQVVTERQLSPRPSQRSVRVPSVYDGIPEINLGHLKILTDDNGIIQHSLYTVPDRTHGYCTDDNSRALIVAIRHHALTHEEGTLNLAKRYMSFLHYAFDRSARDFRNFLCYERRWSQDPPSEDTFGRSLWALGTVVASGSTDAVLPFACRLFAEALPRAERLISPRAWAFSLLGACSYLQRFSGDEHARRLRSVLSQKLLGAFSANGTAAWPWCEDVVTYANAALPHALILSGKSMQDAAMVEQGLVSLEWLVGLQLSAEGTVSLIGNQGWLTRDGSRARFDQQPIDACGLVEACLAAWQATRETVWRERARHFLGWFLGSNDTQSVLYDSSTGGCRDGLSPNGPNLNEGAESTLSWLISLLAFHELEQDSGAGAPAALRASSAQRSASVNDP